MDRYAYVNNNPLKYTDPSGHCFEPFAPICVAAAKAYLPLITIAIIGEISKINAEADYAISNFTPEPTPQMADIMDRSDTTSTPTLNPTPMETPQPFELQFPTGSEIFDFVAQPNPLGDPSVIGLIPKEYLGIPDNALQAVELGLNAIWVVSHFYQNYLYSPEDDIYDMGTTSTPSPSSRPPTITPKPTYQTPTPYQVTPTTTNTPTLTYK